MPRYVAFLRAINVGGRFVKMAALADHCRAIGLADVQTHINSGNVIFSSPRRQAEALAVFIEIGLQARLGFMSEAFVRTAAQVQALAEQSAALHASADAGGEVNVIFLRQALTPEQSASVQGLRSDIDHFVTLGREVIWLCRKRQNESKFSNAVLERKLGLRCTLRRASMLQALAAQLGAGA